MERREAEGREEEREGGACPWNAYRVFTHASFSLLEGCFHSILHERIKNHNIMF